MQLALITDAISVGYYSRNSLSAALMSPFADIYVLSHTNDNSLKAYLIGYYSQSSVLRYANYITLLPACQVLFLLFFDFLCRTDIFASIT